jgi:hypothetical protein
MLKREKLKIKNFMKKLTCSLLLTIFGILANFGFFGGVCSSASEPSEIFRFELFSDSDFLWWRFELSELLLFRFELFSEFSSFSEFLFFCFELFSEFSEFSVFLLLRLELFSEFSDFSIFSEFLLFRFELFSVDFFSEFSRTFESGSGFLFVDGDDEEEDLKFKFKFFFIFNGFYVLFLGYLPNKK